MFFRRPSIAFRRLFSFYDSVNKISCAVCKLWNDYTAQQKKTFFIFAQDISTVLVYIRCADSENGLIFAELALVFEIYPLH